MSGNSDMMRTSRRQHAFDLTGGFCTYCRIPLCDDENVLPSSGGSYVPPPGHRFLCVTLKTPKAAGGRATIDNEVPTCHQCSARKGRLGHDAFLMKQQSTVSERIRNVPDETWLQLAEALPVLIVRTPSLPPSRSRRWLRGTTVRRSF
ncbi:hypothetical protein [Methylobacterium sp. 092160098-2]|jgi:hypothetical protein|uniref:hypothetical protein n=1 Tax=Methylobacterium sp. 092160098-2 TaxID=3025129 RepID=UPI0023819D4B|nr:hypothetical protein [Methylobacterium sp. 092160098-2]MDE4914833.1 hypothetical protein [Methylobacterium sp. 092160098-2]